LPYLPPGLELDEYNGSGLLAIALVQTRGLRPDFFPAFLGQDFFLAGYRIFVKHRGAAGRMLRGLRILRSYADSKLMVWAGNLLTHYNYRRAVVRVDHDGERLRIRTATGDHDGELDVEVDLFADPEALPPGSVFVDMKHARRFAGPLPFTFDYEQETDSIIVIEGQREHWDPRAVGVIVRRNTFLDRFTASGVLPVLANAFYVGGVPYRWLRGRREPLGTRHHG
jgi:hypothetical protein